MLEKIKSRFIGGAYFRSLMKALTNFIHGSYDIHDYYAVLNYFLGNNKSVPRIYHILELKYLVNNIFQFGEIYLPRPVNANDANTFLGEFFDFLYPALTNKFAEEGEGPYLYKNIQINKNDIVIDAGANIGMFSALAANKGGIIYAFEPVEYVRKQYLEKTAALNKNINIVPLALSNKNSVAELHIRNNNISGASIIKSFPNGRTEYIHTITLDDWVKQNNIPRIDFIKVDIKGAERLMLEGAQEVLKRFAPKLAICTDHFPDDKEVLTNLILKANPNYKIEDVEHPWKKLYAWEK